MTTREKVIYLKQHGTTVAYLAKQVNCAAQTLTQWVKGDKQISMRLERDVEIAIQALLNELEELK